MGIIELRYRDITKRQRVIHYEVRFPLREIRKRIVIKKILQDIRRHCSDTPKKLSAVYYLVRDTLVPHSMGEVFADEYRCIRLVLCNSLWPYEECLKDIRDACQVEGNLFEYGLRS